MKVLLADDHALFREGMKHILAGIDEIREVVEADSYTQAIDKMGAAGDFDLILVDLAMPGLDNFAGLEEVCQKSGSAPVVVVSAMEGSSEIRQAMNCGASGYIPKTLDSNVVVSALKLVFSGGVYLPPNLLSGDDSDARGRDGGDGKARLTPRQHDVLDLMAKGFSNKEIARKLDLAEGTVKLHVTALLKALEVNNRTQAVIKANSLGLTSSVGAPG
ncbi:MAG: response regulator transcription factor [Rhodospirillaceae bacterium]